MALKYFFTLGICVALAGCLLASPVFALTVSPAKLEISGDPGTVINGEIQLFNEQNNPQTFYSSFANFDSNGETGAPHFLEAKEDLAVWLKTEEQVTLEPNELRKISFSITIPNTTEPGGYFAAIFWGMQPPSEEGGGQIVVGGKVGILVLLRVSGQVEEGGGLLDFYTKGKQKFFTALPISFEYRVNNTGGDRMVPDGQIKIKNLFIIPSATLAANRKESSVLPSSTRKIEAVWGQEATKQEEELGFFGMAFKELKNFHFGYYTANLNVILGSDLKIEKASFSFFVFPWQLLLILLVILLIGGTLGFLGIRQYNKWLISRVMYMQKKEKNG